jgi:type VI protein secretion system component Hcp
MSYAIFIKMDGIKGESRDAKHEGEIEVLSWSLGGNELSF